MVDGVLEVVEPLDGVRRLDAYLKYVDRSPGYAGAVTQAAAEPLHEGPVAVGDRIPFAFELPADALPAWRHPATEDIGTLSWAIVTETDIAAGLDKITMHDVPVAEGAAGWRGPEPPAEGEVIASGGRWDVTLTPDRWALRRGETVTVTMEIGKPGPGRHSLELALACRAGYDVEHREPGDAGTRRETRWKTMHEEIPEVDPAAARQEFAFTIPARAPFSYDGSALCFRWFVRAKEARLLRSDPHLSVRLRVLP